MFEGELSDSQAKALIHEVTEAVVPFVPTGDFLNQDPRVFPQLLARVLRDLV